MTIDLLRKYTDLDEIKLQPKADKIHNLCSSQNYVIKTKKADTYQLQRNKCRQNIVWKTTFESGVM
jgi:hypothetical protein